MAYAKQVTNEKSQDILSDINKVLTAHNLPEMKSSIIITQMHKPIIHIK